MQYLLKTLRRLLYLLAGLLLGYLFTALLLSFFTIRPSEEVECEERQPAYLTTNGVHLFIVLPVEAAEPSLRGRLPVPNDTRFLAFGWGDREFYRNTPTWKELSPGTAFRAAFLNTPAAMHVIPYPSEQPSWRKLEICPVQADALSSFIDRSFQKDERGNLLPIEAHGYSDSDLFFEARGQYSCLRTSNTWVNDALKQAWLPAALWTPFDFGVLWHVG
ncbi:MAG: DUF2459 domain-containing protein [Lewinellaceae bacterium]|nr:DUF2459 domain-containing protein [Lewinellaceae bacterium]MCB9287669.1 DUF2459 domain-containing protein [Lewinellaceae bacterium]